MAAIAAGLFALGLLLGIAATLMGLVTRATAAAEDRAYTRWLAGVAQACTGMALIVLVRYGYHPADAVRDCVYAAMAAAVLAFTTRLPAPSHA